MTRITKKLYSLALLFSWASLSLAATEPRFCSDALDIAPVIGDIHGELETALRTIQRFQKRYGRPIEYVFQVGDLGFDPNGRDTNGKVQQNSLKDFVAGGKIYKKYFEQPSGLDRLSCSIYFVRGNHDDALALEERGGRSAFGPVPIDRNERLFYLPDGRSFRFVFRSGNSINVGALGGVDPLTRPGRASQAPDIGFDQPALNRLVSTPSVDVLLTHQGTPMATKGSSEILALCQLMKPRIHIHGHGHRSAGPFDLGERTSSYSLGRVPAPQSRSTEAQEHAYMGFLCTNEAGCLAFVPPQIPGSRER